MSVSDLKLKVHHPSLYGDACHKKFLNSIFSHPVFQVVLFVIRLVFTCLLLFFGECLLTMEIICIFRDCQPWNFSQLLSRKVQSMRHYQIEMMNYMMVNQVNFRVLAFSQVGLAHCLKIGMSMFQEVDDLSIPLHTSTVARSTEAPLASHQTSYGTRTVIPQWLTGWLSLISPPSLLPFRILPLFRQKF